VIRGAGGRNPFFSLFGFAEGMARRSSRSFLRLLSRGHLRRSSWRSALLLPVSLLIGGLAGAALTLDQWPKTTKASTPPEVASLRFTLCNRPPHRDCVIDGDTFYLGRQSIRIADIDAPEVSPPRCIYEADLGQRATTRLYALLNAGPIEIRGDKNDRYGRQLRTVYRDGRSLGSVLVSEGLARKWTGRREPWCS
jgi:endonuclease YncB( thermonuclease family)